MTIGELQHIPVGQVFADRSALCAAGVHRPPQSGICGTASVGAESIVLSGGYEDDEDNGDWIIYTGQGGQHQVTRSQIRDQEWTRGNAALRHNWHFAKPVRVVRGAGGDPRFSPQKGYRYDGLYFVTDAWQTQGRSGFYMCRFRLERNPALSAESSLSVRDVSGTKPVLGDLAGPVKAPIRVPMSTLRIVRDTAVIRQLKHIYKYLCQVCQVPMELPGNALYVEGAHIRPLGRPHDGPDTIENVICLCPNHHTMFDFGVFVVRDDYSLEGLSGRLHVDSRHPISRQHLQYHRQVYRK